MKDIQFVTSIKPSLVSVFRQPTLGSWHDFRNHKYDHLNKGFSKTLEMSGSSGSRVQAAIGWLLFISDKKWTFSPSSGKSFPYRIVMLTLTLPVKQFHSDQVIKYKCLNQFLVEIKKRFCVEHYIWRAECQENGSIHFHIATNQFVHFQSAQDIWNRCVAKLGYLDKFHGLHGHWSPNSTDIHKVQNVKDMAAYMAKYLSKSANNKEGGGGENREIRIVDGRSYCVSHSLGKLKGFQVEQADPLFDDIWDHLSEMNLRVKHEDHYSLYYGHVLDDLVKRSKPFKEELYKWLNEVGVAPPRRFDIK